MLLPKLNVYFGEIGIWEEVINHILNDFFGYLNEKFDLISFVGKLVFS